MCWPSAAVPSSSSQTMVKNKTHPPHPAGFFEDAPMRLWSQFTARQRDRFVPIPPDANRRVLAETQGAARGAAPTRHMWCCQARGGGDADTTRRT